MKIKFLLVVVIATLVTSGKSEQLFSDANEKGSYEEQTKPERVPNE